MLKIRLQRVGRKHDPRFRIVVTDSKNSPKSGKFLEVLGSYDPRKGEPEIKGEKAKYWISKGAQVSGTVHNIFIKEGIVQGKKINVLPKKSPIKKEESEDKKETESKKENVDESNVEEKSDEDVETEKAEVEEEKEEVLVDDK